jgi:polyhydroxybutyrate depolymerase
VRLKVLAVLLLVTALLLLVRMTGRSRNTTEERTLTFGGLERSYRFERPAAKDGEPAPVVLVLHGGGGTARSMERVTFGAWNQLAAREGFVVVYPQGLENHWNDGRGIAGYRSHDENVDDVGFLLAVVDALAKEFPVDTRRVYSLGISNGGMMSLRLACERPERVAAIGVVAAALSEKLAAVCAPARPVSVLVLNGTDDPLVPYGGGEVGFGRRRLGRVLSTPDTVKFWTEKNGCAVAPTVVAEPDRDPDDRTTVRRETYSGCRESAEVVLVRIDGGGHTWPGGAPYLPEFVVGRVSRELDAAQVLWDFFRKHARP